MTRDVTKIIDRELGSVEDDPDGDPGRIMANPYSSPIRIVVTRAAAEDCDAWVDDCAGYSGADPRQE